jgi:hypothetical protein
LSVVKSIIAKHGSLRASVPVKAASISSRLTARHTNIGSVNVLYVVNHNVERRLRIFVLIVTKTYALVPVGIYFTLKSRTN